jgi:molecular chaperone DnaK (HSP70)
MEPAEAMLAIDFGTATSSAELVAPGHREVIREPGPNRLESWPSAVYLADGVRLVGTPAFEKRRLDPANYATGFKRQLGENTPIMLGDEEFPPEELAFLIIDALGRRAAARNEGPVRRAVLTVPSCHTGADDPRSQLMIAAAERAGFTTVELLPEPVAAAAAPPDGPPFTPGDLVLVYDFGGGTFDTALVAIGPAGQFPEALAHRSLDDCGGLDIDIAVSRWQRDHGPAGLAELLAAGEQAASRPRWPPAGRAAT